MCRNPGELRISKSRAPIRGHLRRSRKSDIAAEVGHLGRLCHLPPCAPPEGRTVGARLRTLRAPLGTHTVGACCASAPNRRASCLGTLRISFVRVQERYSVFEKVSARSKNTSIKRPSCLITLRISFVRVQARDSVFEKVVAKHDW